MSDSEKVLNLIWKYANFDDNSHKQWLIDQLVLELTAGESGDLADYLSWVDAYEKDGKYKWSKGVSP